MTIQPCECPAMKSVPIEEAVTLIPNGATIMIGGFMGVGTPERLLDELVRQKKSELTIICNDAAVPGRGVGKLFDASLVASITASHIGLNPMVQAQMMAKKVSVNLVPQGTLVERIRAGGTGLGGVLTPTGVGTIVEDGKQRIEIDGRQFLLETALRSQFALVHAFLADYLGNLSYALTARNFNPVMAMAADTVIVTAENIVPVGVIAPDHVMTPRSARRLSHRQRVTPWTPRSLLHGASRSSSALEIWSISASASRPWSRTTCRRDCRCSSSRRMA
jgi:acetate CoA/acetoacetate CoA-transferase alpha subunit